MKRRFIATISLFFIVAMASVSYLQFHYFEDERMSLIDQQIDRSLSAILSTDLRASALASREEIEDIVYGALEEEPLNQFIVMRKASGELLYQNQVAEDMSISVPISAAKQLVEQNGHLLRYVSYELPDQRRVLQVGLVLDQRKIIWDRIQGRMLALSGALTLLLIILTILLANYLLRPLEELALYFEYQATNPEHGRAMPAFTKSSPEFLKLALAVHRATERWQSLVEHHGTLLARLAHEIRTPLTIAHNKLSSMKLPGKDTELLRHEAEKELEHAESVTREFMGWSKLEFSPDTSPELFAIPLASFAAELSSVRESGAAIEASPLAVQKVFAKPEHLRLVFENLLENARRYGTPGEKITVRLLEDGFEVESFGAELAAPVRENLGKPFNRGSDRADSTGIGLANVSSVCKRYGWVFSYSYERGEANVFRVRLPQDS